MSFLLLVHKQALPKATMPPKCWHHSQVLVRPPQIHCSHRPQKRYEVDNTSSLQDVSKQPLGRRASALQKRYVCRTYNLLKPQSGCDSDSCHTRQPRQYLNQNGNRRTSKTCNVWISTPKSKARIIPLTEHQYATSALDTGTSGSTPVGCHDLPWPSAASGTPGLLEQASATIAGRNFLLLSLPSATPETRQRARWLFFED